MFKQEDYDFEYYTRLIDLQIRTGKLVQQMVPVRCSSINQSIPTRSISLKLIENFKQLICLVISNKYKIENIIRKEITIINFFSLGESQKCYQLIKNYFQYAVEQMKFHLQPLDFEKIDYVTLRKNVRINQVGKYLNVWGKVYQYRQMDNCILVRYDDYKVINKIKQAKLFSTKQNFKYFQQICDLNKKQIMYLITLLKSTYVYSQNVKNHNLLIDIYNMLSKTMPNKAIKKNDLSRSQKILRTKNENLKEQYLNQQDKIQLDNKQFKIFQQHYNNHQTVLLTKLYDITKQQLQNYIKPYQYDLFYMSQGSKYAIVGFSNKKQSELFYNQFKSCQQKNHIQIKGCKIEGKLNEINVVQKIQHKLQKKVFSNSLTY